MRPWQRRTCGVILLGAGLILVACGGGSGGGAGPSGTSTSKTPAPTTNVATVTIDGGPDAATSPTVNTLYTSVTVCAPGSSTQCQTIDHIQVDTGSYGLRILSSALTLNLSVATASDGNSLVECTQFVDGYSWGPLSSADIQIAGESAHSVPVQVIGSPNFPTVPAACSSTGPAEDTVAQFGANGILGIGVFQQDCGPGCVTSSSYGYYYSCTSTACNPITATLASQVENPVPLFTTDNNGTIIELPSVAAGGETTVTGSLIFGIDTESNNASGTESVLTLDGNGDFVTTFGGQTLNTSFIDSGSDGFFFNDSSIPVCSTVNTQFYCPTSTLTLSATLAGQNAVNANVSFNVTDANSTLAANPNAAAVPGLSGNYSSSTTAFDWGLPFFFGRRVANAIEGFTTSAGTGPYVAF